MSPTAKKFFLANYGKITLALVVLGALVKCIVGVSLGHSNLDFDIFVASSKMLWHRENPYTVLYPPGYYLYSPSAGMFFFGLFAWMPYAVAFGCYLVASVAALFYGLKKLSQTRLLSRPYEELFYFLISFEVLGTLLNGKIETFFVGLYCFVFAAFVRRRHEVLAVILMSIMAQYKLQALAPLMLLLWNDLLVNKRIKLIALAFVSLALVTFLPMVVLSFDEWKLFHQVWLQNSEEYMAMGFWKYPHVFKCLRAFTGIEASAMTVQIVTLGFALATPLYCLYYFWRARAKRKNDAAEWAGRSFSLGIYFSLAFSPMAQSAAYSLYVPFLWDYLRKTLRAKSRRFALACVGLSFALISIVYSDVVGKAGRALANEFALKPLGLTILLLAWLYSDANESTSESARS